MATTTARVVELALREADGLRVALLWHPHEGFASVLVVDSRTGEAFELALSGTDNALDVFHHPFAYAAQRGFESQSSASDALPIAA
jgi:hypothetical protein